MADGKVTIKAVLDASGVKKGLGEVKDALDRLDPSAISDVGSAGKGAEDGLEGAAKAADKAADSAGKAGKGAQDVAKGAGEAADALGKAEGKASGLGDKLQSAGKGMERLGDGLDKVKSFGDSYTKSVTLPIVGAGTAAVAAAVDMDSALTDVRKTVDGTEEQYEALKEAAVEFSRTNAVSASEMLSIEALGAQLGFGIDELQEFGRVASGLDIATNMDAETAATEMAHFANIMGMSHDDIGAYGSTIVDLGNHMATTESDISHMAQRIAGAGKQVGMSEADVLGMAAALSSVGIEAEAGGTAISTIMSNIDMDVASGGENLEAWAAQAGMSADEFAAAWGADVPGALSALLQGMSQGVEEGGNMALMLDELGISSIRQTDTLKRLAGAGDLMSDSIGLANGAWAENTALQAEVDNRNGSLAAQFEMLKNRVTEVAAEVGEPLATALMEAVEAAQPLFDALKRGADAFADMDEGQQRMILGAVGAVAGLGPLLSIVGRLGGPVKALGGAFQALGSLGSSMEGAAGSAGKLIGAGGKAGLFGVAAGLAAVAGALAVNAWLDYKKAVEDAELATSGFLDAQGVGLQDAYSQAGQGVDDLRSRIQESQDVIAQTADMVRGWQDAWSDLGSQQQSLDYYLGVIDELAGKASLTKDEQLKLNDAVDHYNQITGDTLSVDESFNLSKTRDELQQTAKEWYNAAAAAQYEAQMEELVQQRGELQQQKNDALKVLQDAQQAYNEAATNYLSTTGADQDYWDVVMRSRKSTLEDAQEAYDTLSASVEACDDAMDEMAKRAASSDQEMLSATQRNSELAVALDTAGISAADFTEYLAAMGGNAETVGNLSGDAVDKLVGTYQYMATVADDMQVDTAELTAQMHEAGITTADMAAVGEENFARLYREAGEDMDLLKQKIDEYTGADITNEADLDADQALAEAESLEQQVDGALTPKEIEVGSDTTAAVAALDALQALGIEDKEFTVSENGTVETASGQVIELDGLEVGDKSFKVTDDGTVEVLDKKTNTLANYKLPDKTLKVTEQGCGAVQSRLDEVHARAYNDSMAVNVSAPGASQTLSYMQQIRQMGGNVSLTVGISRIVSETVKQTKNARGGFVPGHAAGGIFTDPVLTNVGWVGERGAEAVVGSNAGTAIVPIENRRYMAPFADAVADAMGQRGASTVVHNHYNVGGITYDTDSAVARCVGSLVRAAGIDARRRG